MLILKFHFFCVLVSLWWLLEWNTAMLATQPQQTYMSTHQIELHRYWSANTLVKYGAKFLLAQIRLTRSQLKRNYNDRRIASCKDMVPTIAYQNQIQKNPQKTQS